MTKMTRNNWPDRETSSFSAGPRRSGFTGQRPAAHRFSILPSVRGGFSSGNVRPHSIWQTPQMLSSRERGLSQRGHRSLVFSSHQSLIFFNIPTRGL